MIKRENLERRLHPRIEQRLPVKVVANGYDFATTTENVSCVGAYCNIKKYVPPFTKVMIRLSLPIQQSNKSKPCELECKGVIVRTDDASSGGFNIAIFFNEINENQRNKISRYIYQHVRIPQQPSIR